jgi:hypothetical protein
MNGSTWLRAGALVIGLSAAPLALAQLPPPAVMPPHWGFISAMAAMGMLMVLGILALGVYNENRKNRDKLGLVERLVTSGQSVPRELMVKEPRQLTLLEQRRHDIRRGIAFLCWGIGISLVFYIVSGGNPRAAAWGLLFIVPGLGNFLKAWLTARDIARGAAGGPR